MSERGDTLIEVVFATAVLALIIVLSIGIMNGGTAQSERAVEGTFVRQSIDSQSEMLRFARDAFVNKEPGADALWGQIKGQRVSETTKFTSLTALDNCIPAGSHRPFYLTTEGDKVTLQTGPFTQPETYAGPGNGMWIEATPTTATNYVDFYIYACWDSPSNGPKATTGTIVRLYAPAS